MTRVKEYMLLEDVRQYIGISFRYQDAVCILSRVEVVKGELLKVWFNKILESSELHMYMLGEIDYTKLKTKALPAFMIAKEELYKALRMEWYEVWRGNGES